MAYVLLWVMVGDTGVKLGLFIELEIHCRLWSCRCKCYFWCDMKVQVGSYKDFKVGNY